MLCYIDVCDVNDWRRKVAQKCMGPTYIVKYILKIKRIID